MMYLYYFILLSILFFSRIQTTSNTLEELNINLNIKNKAGRKNGDNTNSDYSGTGCRSDEFACADGKQCIPLIWKCGKKEDCSDGSDEASTTCNKEPIISRFHITSHIHFRYARTVVESRMKNPGDIARKLTFSTIIPNNAFISNFTMFYRGKEYVSQVKERKDARKSFDQAVTQGEGAGLVEQNLRESNVFTVSANVEAGMKVVFTLTYEELLERKLGWYEHVININPGQIVEDLKISVNIDESLPLSKLSVPELKNSNEIDFEPTKKNEIARVEWVKGNETARIEFEPEKEQQRQYGEQGLAGQLLIKYDVDREGKDSEVQVIDGYFVHYFTPEKLKTLPKHVIFVLDISGSMYGEKLVQLKDAMFTILDDMTEKDFFDIITFDSDYIHWQLPSKEVLKGTIHYDNNNGIRLLSYKVIQATVENRKEAIKYTNSLKTGGSTNINAGLLKGLKVAAEAKKHEYLPKGLQSIIVFLSDGKPSVGVRDESKIQENVKNANLDLIPIYSLGFGRDADFNLIRDISATSDAFSRHIYEGSDAALQLEDFFAEIASPLLSDLKFNYIGGVVDNSSISKSHLKTFFQGGEFVIAGKLNDISPGDYEFFDVGIHATGEHGIPYDKIMSICLNGNSNKGWLNGNVEIRNSINRDYLDKQSFSISRSRCIPPSPPPPRSDAQNFLQKLHAFLNIKQLLKSNDNTVNGTNLNKEKALTLALTNNFVTELTSLVVVRPNEKAIIPSLIDSSSNVGTGNGISNWGNLNVNGNVNVGNNNGNVNEGNNNGNEGVGIISANLNGNINEGNYNGNINEGNNNGNENVGSNWGKVSRHFIPFSSFGVPGWRPYSPHITNIIPNPTHCTGNITLFSKTYLRGESMTLTKDTKDLANFDDKVVSIRVMGTCCWELYTQVGFQGKHKIFKNDDINKGLYKSTTDMANMFREASSARRIISC